MLPSGYLVDAMFQTLSARDLVKLSQFWMLLT
jgi:hypothetical protein